MIVWKEYSRRIIYPNQRTSLRLVLLPVLFILVQLNLGSQALSQTSQNIVAVINDDVISKFDLDARIRFVIFTSRLPNTEQTYKRLSGQVLSSLVNERLRLQEAKRRKVTVSRAQIRAAIRAIEQRNKLPQGGLLEQFKKSNIDTVTYERQLEAELAWRQIVRQTLARSGQIAPETLDEQIKLIEANKGKPEYLVAEIYIPFDAARTSSEVVQLANRIHAQIKGGARFSGVARSFSQSASAARGGSLGWIREDQLDPELSTVVQRMERGDLSAPVRGPDGYYILQLTNKRVARGLPEGDATVTLQQIFLSTGENPPQSVVQNQFNLARSVSSAATNCQDMETLGKEIGPNSSGKITDVKVSSLAPNLRQLAQDLEISKASDPIRTPTGILVLMVCSRETDIDETEIRRQVAISLSEQRAELLSRRLMRDLRQAAFIDIRR